MLSQLPGPRSKGTAVATSTHSALFLVSHNIPQKKELLLLGEMTDSWAGAGSKTMLEKVLEKERKRKREREGGSCREGVRRDEREEKGREKKRKQKPDSHHLSQEIKVIIHSDVMLMACTLDMMWLE